jgi:serine/threonine-protein kinase
MPSERVQRRIDRLLDDSEEAADRHDWDAVAEYARTALSADPANEDALTFQGMADAARSREAPLSTSGTAPAPSPLPTGEGHGTTTIPTSFANDRYQVSKFLGEGGKKRVYQAHDTLLDREVAFALIKTEGFDQTSKERISREAQAMGRLGVHPNIVAVLDLGEDDGSPYMVTELMGGGDIEGVLEEAEENRLSLERTIEIGKAVCEGLEFAHARGIVHRDLKPGNVWLTEDGTAKIGDFGLAVMTDRSRLTREGMMVGTVSYMPPEQATGGDITPKADLYSLGAMLYEMVTGRPPFLGDDEIAIIGQHINTPPVAPTWHNGTCPRPLEALIMRLLSKTHPKDQTVRRTC